MHSPSRTIRTLSHSRSRSIGLSTPPKGLIFANQHSTYIQPSTKPDFHSSTAASVTNGSPSNIDNPSSFSPLGKSSYVQQMWFHGAPPDGHVSKEQLSQNIAAMIEDETTSPDDLRSMESNAKVKLLVGEVVNSTACPEQDGMLHSVKLSNVCSPRLIFSSRLKHSPSELLGRRVIVVNNLHLCGARDTLPESMLLCSNGDLLTPGPESKIGDHVTLAGKSPLLSQLRFNNAGIAELDQGTLLLSQNHKAALRIN